jgi:nitroimidazol reductase NimA-like FMN-containing flavoprotein (pyridoxamine 5'-phosphate oxidase superfamily)
LSSLTEARSGQVKQEQFVESREEMEQILREEVLGYLGLDDDGQPYVVPLNYAYAAGKIVFHGALSGLKIATIRRNPRVCFTVARQTGPLSDHTGAPCHLDSASVVCYGRARLVEDLAEREQLLNAFNRHFRPAAAGLARERVERCLAVEITVERMTGRRERDRKCTYWQADF